MSRVLITFAFLLVPITALSMTVVSPEPALKIAERQANTVALSSAILVGRVLAGRDSAFIGHDGRVMVASLVTFKPVRAIKGPLPKKALQFAAWLPPAALVDERPSETRATWRDAGTRLQIVCLEETSGPWRSLGHWTTSPGWTNPLWIARWRWWSAGDERALTLEVLRQVPESLAVRAERAALVHLLPGGAWYVDRMLKGPRADSLFVNTFTNRVEEGGRAILFLTRDRDRWKPLGHDVGIVPVATARIPRWNCSLEEAIERIERALR
jgi:hypothetical protein